jgi:eukaryotic-like serine/threonine-protein kinase
VPAPPGERTEVLSRGAMPFAAASSAQATTALPLVGGLAAEDAPPRRRRRWPIVVALLTVLALIGGVGGWWLAVGRYGTVPGVIGQARDVAQRHLEAEGFTVRWGPSVFSDTIDRNLVATEKPGPDAHVRDGSTITLALSRGVQMVTVPKLHGHTASEAASILKAHQLQRGRVNERYSPNVAKGDVISSQPAAGARVEHGSKVNLLVSNGPRPLTVPDVHGKTFDDAKAFLASLGFVVGDPVERFSDTVPTGQVLASNPPPGTSSFAGATVTLVVSKGPQLYQVPDVTGKKIQDAIAIINRAGFKAKPREIFPFGPGKVVRQTPTGMQPKGTEVELDYY